MKGSKYFLDTNIFLRPIVRDVPDQATDCLKFLEKILKGEISAITSSIILAELNWTLLRFYHYSKFDVAKILNGLTSGKNLKIKDSFNPAQAAKLYADYNVKFVDCLIASQPVIASRKMTIISYDRDFDKLGAKRLEPSELI